MTFSRYERAHLLSVDATAQAQLIRQGEIKARELHELTLERIAEANADVNAIVYLDQEAAPVAGPLGPFFGVPMLLKDLGVAAEGHPDYRGNAMRRRADLRFASDSAAVRRLRESGVSLFGRTNSAEFGLYSDTINDTFGATRNPWNLERSAGGSSGGSAAAVAAGMVAVAQGTDGGGSLRNPAAHCGLLGLKPSRGLVSAGPQAGESLFGISQTGVLTRSVRDAAAMLNVLAGAETGDPVLAPSIGEDFLASVSDHCSQLRIGVLDHDPGGVYDVDPELSHSVRDTAAILEDLGHHVENAWPNELFTEEYEDQWFNALLPFTVVEYEATARRSSGAPAFGMIAEYWYRRGLEQRPGRQLNALLWLDRFRRRVQSWWNEYDILLSPVIPELPRPVGFMSDGQRGIDESISILRFTRQFNTTGQPAITVPRGLSREGLPLAVQLAGRYAEDGLLLAVSAQLEAASPWPTTVLVDR